MKINYKTNKRKVQTTNGKRVYKTYIAIEYQNRISEEVFLDIIKENYKIPHYRVLAILKAIHEICKIELLNGAIIQIPFLGTLRLKAIRAKNEKTKNNPDSIPAKDLCINFLPHKALRDILKNSDHE